MGGGGVAFTVLLLMWYGYFVCVCVCVYNMLVCWGDGVFTSFLGSVSICMCIQHLCVLGGGGGGGAVYVECFLSDSFSISETAG